MSDIVQRLREGEACAWIDIGGCANDCRVKEASSGCLCAEAADTITALRAEVERLKEWNREIALNAREFAAENEKLRAALWDIHAVCNNWGFIWMWPIRRIKRLARAALEEKP